VDQTVVFIRRRGYMVVDPDSVIASQHCGELLFSFPQAFPEFCRIPYICFPIPFILQYTIHILITRCVL
jgi:hypothetical protein